MAGPLAPLVAVGMAVKTAAVAVGKAAMAAAKSAATATVKGLKQAASMTLKGTKQAGQGVKQGVQSTKQAASQANQIRNRFSTMMQNTDNKSEENTKSAMSIKLNINGKMPQAMTLRFNMQVQLAGKGFPGLDMKKLGMGMKPSPPQAVKKIKPPGM